MPTFAQRIEQTSEPQDVITEGLLCSLLQQRLDGNIATAAEGLAQLNGWITSQQSGGVFGSALGSGEVAILNSLDSRVTTRAITIEQVRAAFNAMQHDTMTGSEAATYLGI